MAILKKGFETGFTQTPNQVINNKSLTLKAKGLFTFMLSKPPDWKFSIKGLEAQLKEGRDAISGGLNELEEFGYLTRKQITDGNGLFLENEYIIHADPQPLSDNPLTDYPTTENPIQDNIIPSNILMNKPKKINQKKVDLAVVYRQLKSNPHLWLSRVEFEKLIEAGFSKLEIDNMLDKIDNYKKNKNYNSLYLTVLNWLKTDQSKKDKISSNKAIDNLEILIHGNTKQH